MLKYNYTDCKPLTVSKHNGMVKTASGNVLIEPDSEKARVVEAAIKKHPSALFFRSKAIVADEVNQNSDLFPYDELKKAYKTFENVPFFTNHDNQHVEHAKGKNIFAEWNEDEKSVYVISFVDRDAYPHLCRSIEEGYVTGVSMGASVECSVCSICENRAERAEDFCSHIKERKGRKFSGTVRNVRTGEMVTHHNADVYETNYGLKFIELSAVVDPACPTCHIEGIISNEDYLQKVANIENALRMVKTAALKKKASQQEIDKIEEALASLEGIAVGLIQKRKQVEPEFAGDLVDIISNLQEWLEELVGAGYASLPDDGGTEENGDLGELGDLGEGDALEGNLEGGENPIGEGMGTGGELQANPVAEEKDLSGSETGDVSGLGNAAPKAPITTPVRPKTSKIDDVLIKAAQLQKRMTVKGDDEMAKRRVLNNKKQEKQQTIEILSNTWKEKTKLFEYIKEVPSIQKDNLKLSVNNDDESFVIVAEDQNTNYTQAWKYEDLNQEQKEKIMANPKEASNYFLNVFAKNLLTKGDNRMTDINKQAGATSSNETPEVITEKQLDKSGLYHERTGKEQDSITQKQLEEKRVNSEHDVVTQKQLDKQDLLNKRQNEERDVVTEAQLDDESASPRTGVEKDQVTQAQLRDEGYQTGKERDVVTERQLDSIDKAWERFANRNPEQFKTAKEHMGLVVQAAAKAVVGTGCAPEEICKVASSMVASTKSRLQLMASLSETSEDHDEVDFSKRMAFWKTKNLKVASSTKEDIAKTFVGELRKIAEDQTINPDVLIDAVDVVGDGEFAEFAVSKQVDEVLSTSDEIEEVSVKSDLRDALKDYADATETTKEERTEQREEVLASINKKKSLGRKAERDQWKGILNKTAAKKSDYVVETSFDEMGAKKEDADFRKKIVSFTKGAMASQNLKVASITNVTIDGDTIQIAVQTDEDSQEVNIPIGNNEAPEAAPLEEDLTGEGYSSDFEEDLLRDNGGVTASSKKMTKKAQSPMGGGQPGGEGDGMIDQGPATPDQGVGTDPVSALTTDDEAETESQEVPSASKQLPPWCVCPLTGSSDVDVEVKEDGSIIGKCNESGVEFEAMMKTDYEFKILNPLEAQMGGGSEEEPEAPEVPALPVAAKIDLNKNNLLKIGNNLKNHGHVCPGCGKDHCEVESEKGGHTTYKCASCGTKVKKDLFVEASDPEKGYMQIDWLVFPDVEGCSACKEKAKVFAGRVKADKMLKEASTKKDDFPTSNCVERLARKYGGDAIASYGPCKGKVLAECVCDQLQKLGLRKVRHMERLASVASQKDERDICIEEQITEGATQKEAETLCGCLQSKYAENHDKFLVQALKEDVEAGREDFDLSVLTGLQEAIDEEADEAVKTAQFAEEQQMMDELEADIGAELPPEEFEEEEVVVSIPKEVAEEIGDAAEKTEAEGTEDEEMQVEEVAEENVPVAPEEVDVSVETIDENTNGVQAMESSKVKRNAGVQLEVEASIKEPEQVKDVESTLDNVPRKNETLGKEGKDNIDVPLNEPDVPRNKKTMGQEGKDNIDVDAGLPKAPVDSSYMGHEKEVQKDMPGINNKLKGTVIAKNQKLKEVDTVEDDVEAGVPRGDATMGNEGSDNIDVKENDPNVPRKNETLGNEGKDNIDVDADSPEVPVGEGDMGHEKEVQKDMPATNDRYLKQVKQEREQKIVEARREEARQVATWLAANGRIGSDRETINDVVQVLASFQIDQIEKKANALFPEIKTASTKEEPQDVGHSIPAMKLESKNQKEDEIQKLSSFIDHWGSKFDS